jgi:adenylyltransferase/sulfurtransferase
MPSAGSLPTCDTVGVLNTVPAVIASIQATEALKILLKKEYRTELVVYDIWNSDLKQIKIKRNDSCECCADSNFQYLGSRRMENTTVLCGRNSVQIIPAVKGDIDLEDLSFRLKKVGDVKFSLVHLNFETDDVQLTVFRDGRAIIKGTDSETQAKSIYAKYIGN